VRMHHHFCVGLHASEDNCGLKWLQLTLNFLVEYYPKKPVMNIYLDVKSSRSLVLTLVLSLSFSAVCNFCMATSHTYIASCDKP
jgi:hypothetical protein